jgi:hypothetical protein
MDTETLKVLAPYFTSVLGAIVAIGITIYNNSSKTKAIQNKLTKVDDKITEVDEDFLADGVAGKQSG